MRLAIPKRRGKKVGLPPGAVVFTGEEKEAPVHLSVIDYDGEHLKEYTPAAAKDIFPLRDSPAISWINIDGVHDTELIKQIGEHFQIHPLILEDIASIGQRPKIEDHADHLYIVVKMLYYDEETRVLRSEQVSLVVGPRYVISFQEDPGDVFEPVRNRLRAGSGRIRRRGSDYLAYALLDVIVDHYFVVLEAISELTEDLEDAVIENPDSEVQHAINDLRRELIFMRRAVWPVRELFFSIERSDSPLLSTETRPFLRDTYDHAVHCLDIIESLRDVLTGLHDLYMSNLSNRLNEVMKVLTIIGTIFIPLTFIAGVYGMNFEYMPELEMRYAYPTVMAVMLAVALALLLYFRRRKWI